MSDFYIEKGDNMYALSVTSDVDVVFSGTTTKNPVEAGFNVTDHYIKENVGINFRGIVTDIVNITLPLDMRRDVESNVKAITALWESTDMFTTYVEGFTYENCVFNNVSFTKTSGMGTTYSVALSIEQLRVSKRASLTSVPEQSEEVAAQHKGVTSSGDNNTKQVKPKGLAGYLADSDNPSFLNEALEYLSEEGNETVNINEGGN